MRKNLKVGGALVAASAVLATAGIYATFSGAHASHNTIFGSSGTGKPVLGGSVTLDTTSNVKDLDPALAYDTTSGELTNEMYQTLMEPVYKSEKYKLQPGLATGYKVSDGGKTYTFTIRKGVTFWNGDKMTAESFVHEFERVLTPSIGSPFESFFNPIVQGAAAFYAGKAKTISGVYAPNPYTLVVKLTKPEPFFIDTTEFISAVDQSYINKVGNKAFDATSPMGTGPFMLKSVTPNQIVLVKNRHYWQKDKYGNKLPYLNSVTINVNKNGQLDALHFEQGQTAILGNMIGIPSSVYPQFVTNPKLKADVHEVTTNSVYYIGLNNKIKPFNNPLVRRAVEYAINKKKILQLLNNRGTVANQPLPPGIAGYNPHLPADANYTYNPAKAKKLLAKAGYSHGFTTTLYSANDPDTVKLDTSIQNDLANVGIKAKVDATDWNTFLDVNERGKTPIYQLAWIQDFPDASDFLNTLFNTNEQPANNSSLYSNRKVDALLNKAQTDNNQAQRIKMYKQISAMIMKDAPWAPLYYGVDTWAVQPWVHNFFLNPNMDDPLQYIWVTNH